MDQRWWAEVGQWREELEAQMEADEIERVNALADQARDEQFREELEAKFPLLKGWK